MVIKRKSRLFASFVVVLATTTFLATNAISAAPDPTATQPQVQVTAPPNTPETKTAPASAQKNLEKPEKTDKKGPMAGMMLTLFAIITGHQGATR